MFDQLIRELLDLQGTVQIPIELEIDDQGYLDRQCPSIECGNQFKILLDDWVAVVSDEVVYCPRCHHEEVAAEWNTPEQIEHISGTALNHVQRRIDDAFVRGAKRFNSGQNRSNFISMSMSYRPSPIRVLMPPNAAEVMTQVFRCEGCGCRHASLGAAFFCPACGRTAILESFANAMETVRNTIVALPTVLAAVEAELGKDSATDIARHIKENALVKVVRVVSKIRRGVLHEIGSRARLSRPTEHLPEHQAIRRDVAGSYRNRLCQHPGRRRISQDDNLLPATPCPRTSRRHRRPTIHRPREMIPGSPSANGSSWQMGMCST